MCRILVVDNTPDFRATLSGLLTDAGHTVRSAANEGEALTAFTQETFDFALIDGCHCPACALHDVRSFAPMVRAGGILALHDTELQDEEGGEHEMTDHKGWGVQAARRLIEADPAWETLESIKDTWGITFYRRKCESTSPAASEAACARTSQS